MFGTSTTGMTTSALETSEEKRISSTSRLVKLFTVMGPGFHAVLLFALLISSCVAFAKGSVNASQNRVESSSNDLGFNTFALFGGLAMGAFLCFIPVAIVTARASCLSKGAQLDIEFVHREVVRTLWVIVPLVILGWISPSRTEPGLIGTFSLGITPGSPRNVPGTLACIIIHWAL